MALQKNSTLLWFFAAILIMAMAAPGSAETWVTHTSLNDIRQMRAMGDTLYLATSGGLLEIVDPNEPGRIFDNLNGLGTVDIFDIAKDSEGQLWVAGAGRLVRLGDGTSEQYFFLDNEGTPFDLYSLADDGEYLWVGTEIGLVLFSKENDGGQIQDSYDLFGNLSAAPKVYDIELIGDTIWLATSAGLAAADKSNHVALNAPAGWSTFSPTQYPQLGTGGSMDIAVQGSDIFVAGTRGAYRLNRTPTDTTFEALSVAQDTLVTDLVVSDDTLWLFYSGGIASHVIGTTQKLLTPPLPSAPLTGLRHNGEFWLALSSSGVYRITGASLQQYPHTGMPGNLISDIVVHNGLVTVGFPAVALAQYDGQNWIARTTRVGGGTTVATVDRTGAAWFGAIDEGVWRILDDSVANYDENNSTLRGNNDGERGKRYIVVRGMVADGPYIFVNSYRALNGYPVAIGRLDQLDNIAAWDSLGVVDGITDTFVTDLDFQNGSLVVGTESNGLFWCFLGPDPFDKSDDFCYHFTEDNAFLRSNTIRVLQFSSDGTLWVGTNFGLSRWDAGIERFVDYDLPPGIGPNISDIAIDSRNNIWVAAGNGIARIDGASGVVELFNTFSSGLVSDDVRSLTIDPRSGDLYIGTGRGMSILKSTTAAIAEDVLDVLAFPNPYVITSPYDTVSFNYAKRTRISVYNAAGELVRNIQNRMSWDGRNERGEQVASGVYVFVLEDEQGTVARGKILLIRK